MKYNIKNRIKDTAIVNLTDFENAIDLYEEGEIEKALELMFGLTVLGLGGDFETDDREIRRLLRNREYTVVKSNEAYCNKVKAEEEKRIEKLQLKEIAEMLSNGVTQQVIADTLGVSLRTVAYRIGIMKAEFPNIYSGITKSAKSAKECKQMQYNENDNVNVNENENVNVNENVNYPELLCSNEKMSKMSKKSNDVKQCQNNENENENENDNVNDNVNDNDNVKVSAEGQKKLAELDKYINDQIERVMEEKGYKLVKDFDVSVDRIQIDNEYRNRKKRILEQYKI